LGNGRTLTRCTLCPPDPDAGTGFTITAVLTFALGIGANIAIFSIVYAVLLKGLAYRDPDRLLVAHADVDYEGAHRPVPMFIQPTQFGLWQSPLPGIESVAFVTSSVETLDDRVAADAAQPRFRTVLLVSLAGLALAIAAVGLSGVIADTVSHRTREIGIRMALGATSGDVLRMVMRDGLVVALGGLAAGFAGALVVTRTLATLLFGVTPTDALSFATASAALLLITLVASYLPARRAARVDPMVVLRAE
jgi:ABC-type antimicrobial peptide transport system permease subunit